VQNWRSLLKHFFYVAFDTTPNLVSLACLEVAQKWPYVGPILTWEDCPVRRGRPRLAWKYRIESHKDMHGNRVQPVPIYPPFFRAIDRDFFRHNYSLYRVSQKSHPSPLTSKRLKIFGNGQSRVQSIRGGPIFLGPPAPIPTGGLGAGGVGDSDRVQSPQDAFFGDWGFCCVAVLPDGDSHMCVVLRLWLRTCCQLGH
jgi:hypothetical protein